MRRRVIQSKVLIELLLSATRRYVKKPNRYQGLMIRPALIFLSAASILFLAACASDDDTTPHHRHPYGYDSSQTEVAPEPDTGVPPAPDAGTPDTGTGPIAPTPPPPPPPAPDAGTGPATSGTNGAGPQNIPYAVPVVGKPGFVTSPFAPGSGYVDVRGFPPGTEVKDPYTNKVFLVP